jgi:hypothetical protein
MRNMATCIPCTAFVMEILQLHRRNTSVDVQIGGNPATVHHRLWKTGAFMLPAYLGRGRRSLRNDKEMFDLVQDDPSTSARSLA